MKSVIISTDNFVKKYRRYKKGKEPAVVWQVSGRKDKHIVTVQSL